MQKSVIISLIVLWLCVSAMPALVSDYTFTQGNTTYTPAVGTPILIGADDSNSGANNIGFSFVLDGSSFTQFVANSDGNIRFGTSATTDARNPIATVTNTNAIALMARDGLASGGIVIQTLGTAPSRVCVIEYPNWYLYYGSSADRISMQIRLTETSNTIAFVYGSGARSSAYYVQVGIRSSSTTSDFVNRSGNNWAASTAGTVNSDVMTWSSSSYPQSGQYFQWEPYSPNNPPFPATVVSPAHTATNVSLLADLQWIAGSGFATGFRLYLGTDNPPTNIANGIDLPNVNSYDPPADFGLNTIYYWKVIPYNEFGDAANCPVWSFTTLNGQTNLTSPINGDSELSVRNLPLTFDPVSGAAGYFIDLGTTPGGTDVLNHVAATSPWVLSFDLSFATTYYWSVFTAISAQEVQSTVHPFNTAAGVPTYPNPGNGAVNQYVYQRILDWEDIPGAENYTIRIGTTPGGNDVANNVLCMGSAYTHATDWIYATTYYWSVTMHAQSDTYQVTGSQWSFSTEAANVNMTNGYRNVPLGITFNFYDSAGPSGAYQNNEEYTLTFNPAPDNAIQANIAWINTEASYDYLYIFDGTSVSDPLLAVYHGVAYPGIITATSGSMTFRYHTDSSGTSTGWAATISNTSKIVAPNPALNNAPADAAMYISPLATLNWLSGGGFPTGYRIYFGTDNPPTNLVNGLDVAAATTYDPTGDLTINTTYYWQVIPYNAYGTATACPVWSFTTLNGQATLTSPLNLATNVTVANTTLTFDSVPGATGYYLNLGTTPGGTNVCNHTAVTSPWSLPSNLDFNTTYYWSVFSAFPGQQVQSAEWSFTTTTGVPITPNPYDAATGLNVASRTLDWEDVAGAGYYTINVGTTPGGNNIVNSAVCATSSYSHPVDWAFITTYYWTVTMHSTGDTYQINGGNWSFTTGEAIAYMHNGSLNVPEGAIYNFYDSGGPLYTYQHNEYYTLTFYPLPGRFLIAEFSYFTSESGYDYLGIYDGPSTGYPSLFYSSGSYNPGVVTSTGPMTFTFRSDGSVAYSGWAATIMNSDYGVLSGTVTAGGSPASGAIVSISSISQLQTTSALGAYSFPQLRAGNYTVSVTKVGYASQSLSATVVADQTATVNAALVSMPALEAVSLNMNGTYTTGDLNLYFNDNARDVTYSVTGNTHLNWVANGNDTITLTPQTGWFGVEYINIRGVDSNGDSGEKTLKVTVLETWTATENFDHAGSLPTGWTQVHSGTTEFIWQSVLVSGVDYNVKTTALTGRTATERLVSTAYNLSTCKDVTVSFNCNFLPYGAGSGVLAYSLNNITFVNIETMTVAFNGVKTYSLPILEGKPSVRFRWSYTNTTPNAGQSNYWMIDNFQIFAMVKDTTLPTQITGLSMVTLSSSTATLSWQPTSDVYFSKYEVYISTDATVNLSDRLWSISNDTALNNISHTQTTVTGLSSITYWAAVRAIDQSNNASALSTAISFTVDSTPPALSTPLPSGQPTPLWLSSRTVTIGCTINDLNLIDLATVMYRFDSNGNGSYDAAEGWTLYSGRNTQTVSAQVTYDADGTHAFEWKASDIYGNVGYSGSSDLSGISDDWVVRIDTSAPALSSPNPPLPEWVNSRTVNISCNVVHTSQIDASSVRYRYDRNGNGIYDAEEPWTAITRDAKQPSRDSQSFSTTVIYQADGVLGYEFRVSGVNGITGYSGTSGSEGISDDWVVRIDASAPDAITNFYVQSVADSSVELRWTASADVHFAGYEIYYALSPSVSLADPVWSQLNDPILEAAGSGLIGTTITGLLPARRYYFLLRATDSVANVSQYPQIINAMTTSSALPSTPSNLVITVVGNDILLDWDDVTTDINSNIIAISNYDIYVGETPDFDCTLDTLIGSTVVSDFSITDAVSTLDRVFFRVKAVSGSIRKADSTLLKSQMQK